LIHMIDIKESKDNVRNSFKRFKHSIDKWVVLLYS
jgi:hypothetical protein